ncbi:hypothetical protein Q3304_08380 [Clostridioides sp. GD02377]|uniref:hypothetical protein n=1 Tax=unclassified Clostridioides TaxID=2635829 RepID=UPI0038A77D5F
MEAIKIKIAYFIWELEEEVSFDINNTHKEIKNQQQKLLLMLESLKEKFKSELSGVYIINFEKKSKNEFYSSINSFNKKYLIKNSLKIYIGKVNKKNTWNDVYKIINSVMEMNSFEFVKQNVKFLDKDSINKNL